jgi:hypothetical protein
MVTEAQKSSTAGLLAGARHGPSRRIKKSSFKLFEPLQNPRDQLPPGLATD